MATIFSIIVSTGLYRICMPSKWILHFIPLIDFYNDINDFNHNSNGSIQNKKNIKYWDIE